MNEQNYLIHHGVKGMKWGVRKDGHDSTDKSTTKWGVKKDEYKTADKATRKKIRQEYRQTDEYKQKVEKIAENVSSVAGSVIGATIGGEAVHLLGGGVMDRVLARSAGSLAGSALAAYILKARKAKKKVDLKQTMNEIKEKGVIEYGKNVIKGTPYDILLFR